VQKYILGNRVVGVGLHSIECPEFSFDPKYLFKVIQLFGSEGEKEIDLWIFVHNEISEYLFTVASFLCYS